MACRAFRPRPDRQEVAPVWVRTAYAATLLSMFLNMPEFVQRSAWCVWRIGRGQNDGIIRYARSGRRGWGI